MAESVIVWNTRDPLGGRSPEEFEAEVRRLLQGRVLAAYLFGSYGTEDFGRDSDIDLILIAETGKPFVERALDFSDLIDLVPDMDLLVYTPEEFSALTIDPSPGFWTSVVASLRRII
ncbi:MAG TPA: nucleotidyltransferase domain-containing protein [Rectinemataceae bacterium]|nr:nucleotidyltransferase domain-containing protein [Rectinemataceae bacterium]